MVCHVSREGVPGVYIGQSDFIQVCHAPAGFALGT